MSACTNLFFFPDKESYSHPLDWNLQVEEHFIPGESEEKLHAWFIQAKNESCTRLVVVFHGNAQNISAHFLGLAWLTEHDYCLFIFDYRGYGRSDGVATLDNALSDSKHIFDYVLKNYRERHQSILIFGQSLGASLATITLAEYERRLDFDGLILESGFADFSLVARQVLARNWLTWPVQWLGYLIDTSHSPMLSIAKLAPLPILLMHSQNDEVIPFSHVKLLYDAAKAPKRKLEFKSELHYRLWQSEENRAQLLQELRRLSG